MLDAWGKFPSGIFSGNFHEFGAFSQCFNITRKEELYKTQYCLGHLTLNVDGWLQQTSHQHIKQVLNTPNILQARNLRDAMPK